MDASSGQALEQSYADMLKGKDFSKESLLVFENADPMLVLEDHLPTPFNMPILVTSMNPAIGNWTLCPDYAYHLSESISCKAIDDIVKSIERAFNPGQRVTTLVANGGSGKTQVALKFAARHASM